VNGIFGRRPGGWAPDAPGRRTGLLGLVNGVMVGIGGTYLVTVSVTVTGIAAVAAVLLASIGLILNR
jgi:hypothetical protein